MTQIMHSKSKRGTMPPSTTQSPFLRLPAELRNKIFTDALTIPNLTIRLSPRFYTRNDALALLRVNKQINCETALLPYTLNVLNFFTLVDMRLWLGQRSSVQINAIHSVSVTVLALTYGGYHTWRTTWDLVQYLPRLKWMELVFDDRSKESLVQEEEVHSIAEMIHGLMAGLEVRVRMGS